MLTRRGLTAAGCAALLVAGTLGVRAAEVIEQVVVKVNGEIITKTEFEQRQVAALRQRPEFASGAPSNDELSRAIADITPNLVLNAVDELLLMQRGKELGFTLGDEQFRTIVDNIKRENKVESEEDFQAALKQEGITLADLRKSVERQMLISRVDQQEIADRINVTDEEAKAYYAKNADAFVTPGEITLREILIEVPAAAAGVNVAQDEAAKAKADAVRTRLLAGEPFAKIAAEVSDAPSKANGGLIGPFKRTDLAPALQSVIDPLKPGDVSQVIRVTRGYQLFFLDTRTDERVQTFEAARGDISDRVAQTKHLAERQKYVEKLREQAIIQWRNDELKKAYDQALAERKAATPGA